MKSGIKKVMEQLYFNTNKSKFLLIYDISDDKRRNKLAKLFESYGRRVQYSAFEFCLDYDKKKKMLNKLNDIAVNEDNIRIYSIEYNSESIQEGNDKSVFMSDVIIL